MRSPLQALQPDRLFVVIIVGYSSVFTVSQTERCWWCGSANPCASSPTRA